MIIDGGNVNKPELYRSDSIVYPSAWKIGVSINACASKEHLKDSSILKVTSPIPQWNYDDKIEQMLLPKQNLAKETKPFDLFKDIRISPRQQVFKCKDLNFQFITNKQMSKKV